MIDIVLSNRLSHFSLLFIQITPSEMTKTYVKKTEQITNRINNEPNYQRLLGTFVQELLTRGRVGALNA